MGYYIAANEMRKGYAARGSIRLDTALHRFDRWDIFVSHKSNDAARPSRSPSESAAMD